MARATKSAIELLTNLKVDLVKKNVSSFLQLNDEEGKKSHFN